MSNPGVILLARTKTECGDFIIEDNLGEAVHLHLGNIRVDMTIDDLNQLAQQCVDVLDSFISLHNFSCKELDPIFLAQISDMLPDIQGIQRRKIKPDKFRVRIKNKYGIPVNRKIMDSRISKALQGNRKEDDTFLQQENYIFQTNAQRTDENLKIIEKEGYNPDKGMVVTFNGQDFIRDGQHRVASLCYLGKNDPIETLDLLFKNEKYSLPEDPAVQFFFIWNLRKIKKMLLFVPKWIWKKRNRVKRLLFRIYASVG